MDLKKDVPQLRDGKNQRPRWGRLAQIIKFIFILNCIGIMQLYFSSRLLASLPPPAVAPDRITKARDPAAPNAHSPLSHALLRGSNADKLRLDKIAQYYKVGKPTVMDAMKRMYDGKPLDPKYVRHILIEGKKILSGLDTIYDMPIPPIKEKHGVHSSQNNMGGGDEDGKSSVVTIVGDIHGQYYNIVHIFKTNGFPSPDHPYIFNGDYTDRGPFSIECILSLLLIKLNCDECIHMTRGNHESSYFYNGKLRTQVQAMYGEETWQLVIDVLNELPIGIVLDKHILVMHAGIPRLDLDIESIRKIKKGGEPDEETEDGSLLMDLLWAETTENKGISVEANRGYLFGPDITEKFLQTNNLDLIVRGHSYTRFGYYKSHNDSVITIHSAPRMLEEEEEEMHYGTFMNIYSADGKMHIEQFQSTTTPMMIDWRTL